MSLPKVVAPAVFLVVSISVCSGYVPVVRLHESSKSKGVENNEGAFIMRQLKPAQSLPMISLQRSNKHHSLTVPGVQLKNNSICSCQGMKCGCCMHLQEEAIWLNVSGCVNVTYLSKEIGFEFTFSVDGVVLIDKKISVKNPPPLCAQIPYLKDVASACVLFHDLDFQNKQFSGCVAVEVEVAGEVILKYDLGCFHIPPSGDTGNLNPSDVMLIKMLQARGAGLRNHRLQTLEDLDREGNSICACKNYNCGCCIRMHSALISLNETGCLNVSYLPSELGFEFEVTLNGIPIIDEKISVQNPPPACVAVPYLHKLASVCVKFRDLEFHDKQFSGCSALSVMLAGITVENFDLGCFHIPPKFEAAFRPQIVIN